MCMYQIFINTFAVREIFSFVKLERAEIPLVLKNYTNGDKLRVHLLRF